LQTEHAVEKELSTVRTRERAAAQQLESTRQELELLRADVAAERAEAAKRPDETDAAETVNSAEFIELQTRVRMSEWSTAQMGAQLHEARGRIEELQATVQEKEQQLLMSEEAMEYLNSMLEKAQTPVKESAPGALTETTLKSTSDADSAELEVAVARATHAESEARKLQGEVELLRDRLEAAAAQVAEARDEAEQQARFGQNLSAELRAELADEQKARARAEGQAVAAMRAQKAAAKAAITNACETVAISCLDAGLPLSGTTIREIVDYERNAGKLVSNSGGDLLQRWLESDAAEVAEKGVLAAIRRAEQAEGAAESAREAFVEERQHLQTTIGKLQADLLEARVGR
jgi:hypothetical protein